MNAPALDGALAPSAEAELLGLVPVTLHADVRRATDGLRVMVELLDSTSLVAARIATRCPEIILVDADMLGCPEALCRLARSSRPDVTFVALSCFWSEREAMLQACADAIVHKPIRDDEWTDLFARLSFIDAVAAATPRTPHRAA